MIDWHRNEIDLSLLILMDGVLSMRNLFFSMFIIAKKAWLLHDSRTFLEYLLSILCIYKNAVEVARTRSKAVSRETILHAFILLFLLFLYRFSKTCLILHVYLECIYHMFAFSLKHTLCQIFDSKSCASNVVATNGHRFVVEWIGQGPKY